jgi:hypothetical protein
MTTDKIRIRDLRVALPFTGAGVDLSIGDLERATELFDFDVEPPWQRGHVWLPEQRACFVGHVLVGGMVPHLIVREPDWGGTMGKYEVVDGKQRLTSLLMWLRGEIPADLDGRIIWIDDTDRHFAMSHTIRADFVRVKLESEILQLYLRLNSGGTPHTPDQIARVRVLYQEARAREAAQPPAPTTHKDRGQKRGSR